MFLYYGNDVRDQSSSASSLLVGGCPIGLSHGFDFFKRFDTRKKSVRLFFVIYILEIQEQNLK